MGSEWLNKVLSSYSESVEQSNYTWQRTNSFFDEAEDLWSDHAAKKFRQHYLMELSESSILFISGLSQQYEILNNALKFIEDAEAKKRLLDIFFDDFSQACSDTEELSLLVKNNITKTEDIVVAAEKEMIEVRSILQKFR